MSWSHFVEKKSYLCDEIYDLIRKIKAKDIVINYIRCDNAGENQSLEKQCQVDNTGIEFEYTPRRTTQNNAVVERKFQTLFNRLRATLNRAGIPMFLRFIFWTKCASTITITDTITIRLGEV